MAAKADADFLREARQRFTDAIDADRENRKRDEEDRKFHKGEQWTKDEAKARQGRITLTIPRTGQFVKQVTGEMRQNKPAIRVLPREEGREELAKVYSAIIRHIESNSDAHRIYNKAGEQAVIGGIGWFRILAEYADDKSFDQEICVKPIRNPLSVVPDPDARGLVREDMQYGFVTELISRKKFKRLYPKAHAADFDSPNEEYQTWINNDFVRVAEYWYRVPKERTLTLFSDGSTDYIDDLNLDEINAVRVAQGLEPIQIVRQRKVESFEVKWCRMTGLDKIDEGEWKGRWIPLIPVVGEEIEAGDEIFRHGLIHFAKDAAKSYNYARSAMVERIGDEPKAPWLVTANHIKNYKGMWEGANKGNPAALVFDIDPLAPGLLPQRVGPPQMAAAWYQEAQVADQDMKATTGIYDTGLGAPSNETSGRAIIARDQQGETSTFVYVDNLSASIRHAGQVLVDIIPHYYSSDRVVRIMGEDGSIESYARINTLLPDGTTFNDLSQGDYDVEVTVGPAYATKRQLAADSMMQFVQAVPKAGEVASDIIAKSMDWPNADKLAGRLEKMLPPGIDPELDKKRQEEQGPPPPNPAEQASMQAMQFDLATKEQMARKATADANRAEAEAEKARIEAQQLAVGYDPKLALTERQAGHKAELEAFKADMAEQRANRQQDHDHALSQRQADHSEYMAERGADHGERMAEQTSSSEE